MQTDNISSGSYIVLVRAADGNILAREMVIIGD